jgi:polyisoprenyl-phosphate glycosyltransferase
MDTPVLSIVVPTYNEAMHLQRVLAEISHYAKGTNVPYEMIVVNDGSTDSTWGVLRDSAGKDAAVKAIKLSRNFGKEAAITAGLRYAKGSAVIIMDSDLQHPPSLIPVMVDAWKKGNVDIVEAVKQERGNETLSYKIGARVFYWLMRRLAHLQIDNASDFKLLDRKVVDAFNRLHESARFFRGIVTWLGFRKVQVAFSVPDGVARKTRWSFVRLIHLGLNAATAFTSLPLHFVTLLGVATFVFSVLLGIQTLYMKFSGAAVTGFTTVILLLLFIGSVLMISLGIIGLYISRIFDEVKKRPIFIEEDTLNL